MKAVKVKVYDMNDRDICNENGYCVLNVFSFRAALFHLN